jgi:hypothetical protein
MAIVKVYLSDAAWAYKGVYQQLGNLAGISDNNEKLWTMLGALILELRSNNIHEVVIYNDSRIVDEWNETVTFLSNVSRKIAVSIKNIYAKKFIKLELKKLNRQSIDSEIQKLQLI